MSLPSSPLRTYEGTNAFLPYAVLMYLTC